MENNIEHIKGLIPVGDKLAFPIHWLDSHGYCEYQIFLQHIKGIQVEPTTAMVEGAKEHQRLEDEFLVKAVPGDFDKVLDTSRTIPIVSRELKVQSGAHGIYGSIDEVQFTPSAITVIDDKPGTRMYESYKRQIYGYCLALKERIFAGDGRPIIAAIRERGTGNIHWDHQFDTDAETQIINIVNRVHMQLARKLSFRSNLMPNKCRACKFNGVCDRNRWGGAQR